MIVFAGAAALSPFRLERLNQELERADLSPRIQAVHWLYFVEPGTGSDVDAQETLARILQARVAGDEHPETSRFRLPRLGTISPWSSKATEILRGCGLPVGRVERGQRLMVRKSEAAALLKSRGHKVTPQNLAVRE